MATYAELQSLVSSPTIGGLRTRILQATIQKAYAVSTAQQSTPTMRSWAASALADPQAEQTALLNFVVSANSSKTVVEITNLTDADVQTAVNNCVDKVLIIS